MPEKCGEITESVGLSHWWPGAGVPGVRKCCLAVWSSLKTGQTMGLNCSQMSRKTDILKIQEDTEQLASVTLEISTPQVVLIPALDDGLFVFFTFSLALCHSLIQAKRTYSSTPQTMRQQSTLFFFAFLFILLFSLMGTWETATM